MAEESAVKVCVRVRPLIEREEKASAEDAEPVQMFWKADHKSIQQIDDGNSGKSFIFDRVFTADENTNQLYQSFAKPLVVSAVEGYNGTIFAYGQTSSGKTFTMMGSSGTPGVIPLAVEDVFQTIKNLPKKEFLLRVSYMEIYNETVTDLLVDSWKRKPLEVREASNKNIYVADLTEEVVTSPAQALNWIRKGEKNRHYGQTKMNHRSSRSHTIFRMILESRDRSDPASGENADGAIIVSHLNLVDLAGSERASQTGAEGARFKEGCNINRSLFTLGQVIKKLTDENQKGFTNYRDSKLTRILQNSLGGNAKTVIICTITAVALEDTLSTLQFASTAKKMKNDPHVTEVSDDGALLKRYRNEIVDLKRRLQEVSSVTQTTATEKEVLAQLLQEKDQLQREQEDRIRNLTRLLVTSSNQVAAPKMPKRRVTWGGKMLRLAHPSAFDGGISELSFAEPLSRKRKGDRSCLSEMAGDDEDFQWEIPEELSEDMEINQSSVMIRSFGDSPKDFITPDRMHELSGKVSNLESQLEVEVQRREEATMKVETAEGRVSELEQQLEAELQQKLEALQKAEMMEVRASDLERQLEEKSHSPRDCDDQMRREFAETIQLCEHLASEKEMLATERDYLKQELGMFIEQTESLEKEKAEMSKELEEKRETDEFKSLEEEFRKEHENELQNEISTLKAAVEASELQRQELQNKMDALSQELKKKSDFAEELQNMSGKDLVQEVQKLRRSLDDAEGVSRDTKKEWAHLRSQNISLEEVNEMLTKNHDKMEAEVNSLRLQLESEKTRFKQMQSDLQRELNVVFDENTKLTTLLDGKVPQNLIDSVELERNVTLLNKELTAAREAESTLRAQVDGLTLQLGELSEELQATQTHRDALISAQTQSEDEAQQLRGVLQVSQEEVLSIRAELTSAALTEEQLKADVESLHQTLSESEEEKLQLSSAVQEKHSKLTESEEQREALVERLNEMQQLGKDLEEKLADSEVSRATEEEISKELQEQLNQLTEELQAIRAEKDVLLNDRGQSSEETEKIISAVTAERDQLRNELQTQEQMAAQTQDLIQSLQDELQQQKSNLEEQVTSLSEELHCVRAEKETLQLEAQTSAEEAEELRSTVSSLTAERDQLQTDMQENVEMMIENQAELRTALEKNAVQKELIKQLEAEQTPRQDSPSDTQTLELQTQLCAVREELQSVVSERDALLRERTAHSHSQSEEMEELQRRVTSLSEDREQLQESVDALRQQKQQLTEDMEDQLSSLQAQVSQLNVTLQTLTEQKRELEDSLQESISTTSTTQDLLKSVQEELQQQQQINSDLVLDLHEKESAADQQIKTLTEELQRVSADKDEQAKSLSEQLAEARAEREAMLMEKEARDGRSSVEVEELQDSVSSLRREREQLREETEDKISTLQAQICAVRDELQSVVSERDALLREKTANSNAQSEQTEKMKEKLNSLLEERDELHRSGILLKTKMELLTDETKERVDTLQEEVQQLEEKLRVSQGRQAESRKEADSSLQLLTEANQTISALKDQLGSLDQSSRFKETAASRLQESADHFQGFFKRLEGLLDLCSSYNRAPMGMSQTRRDSKLLQPSHWPKQTKDVHKASVVLGQQCVHVLDKHLSEVPQRLRDYKKLFEELVKSQLDIFEEQRLQDVLLCRAQAGTFSAQDQDFNSLWEQRLAELLDTRNLLVQKSRVVWEKLESSTFWFAGGMAEERKLRDRFDEQMGALSAKKTNNFSELDAFLSQEHDNRSALLNSRRATLLVIQEEQGSLLEELRQLQSQISAHLKDQRSKTSTLLQALKGAPLKTEVSLLKDNQQLALQLQQTGEEVKALCAHRDQLQEAQAKANSMLSNHKEATQLLQTELQDSRARVEDKEKLIQNLKSKLRESERNASPSAAEMEKLRSKLFKVELELRSASDKHQQEIQRMSALLKEKEMSLRKLKENLRITQQQGDETILQGQDLYNRLTDPRGLTLKSVQQEKTKLEEEVQKLKMKIIEMESLVSSQQAEVTKWKSRALKLKVKTQTDAEKPSPPRTPTKRGFLAIAGSSSLYSSPKKVLGTPRKVLDSPRKVLDIPQVNTLDSPKSRFFDVAGSSDLLSRTCPKQFFDNSSLGTVPGAGASAGGGVEWSEAPEMEECCTTQ